MSDIFELRDRAQKFNIRNAIIEPDPDFFDNLPDVVIDPAPGREAGWNPVRVDGELRNRVIIDHFASPEGPRCANGCGNLLTIEDRYSQCRECILSGRF